MGIESSQLPRGKVLGSKDRCSVACRSQENFAALSTLGVWKRTPGNSGAQSEASIFSRSNSGGDDWQPNPLPESDYFPRKGL
jgi:hypothetical protein